MKVMLFLIFILSVVIVVSFFIARKQSKKQIYTQFLMDNSIALKYLFDINKKYNFYVDTKNFNEENVYDNEFFYDNISCEDYLIYQLQYKKYDIEKEIKNIQYNKSRYAAYKKEINSIKDFGKFKNNNEELDKKYLLSLEKNIFQKNILNPKLKFGLEVSLYCSKINGEIYASKREFFYSEKILELIKRLNDKNRGFYNDREIWDALCRVERGRVSNKMRFSIYQRDGYRCRICGRTELSDYLEIDHIKPIAKGGKSEYNNLQTLCRRCNKNKGDSY